MVFSVNSISEALVPDAEIKALTQFYVCLKFFFCIIVHRYRSFSFVKIHFELLCFSS